MLKLPSKAALILGVAGGILTGLNVAVFQFAEPWHSYVTVALLFITGLGVSPLVGTGLLAALHIPQSLALTVTSALGVLAVAIQTFAWAASAKGIVTGIIAFVAAIGFAPTTKATEAAIESLRKAAQPYRAPR